MNKTRSSSNQNTKRTKSKLTLPAAVALAGALILVIALFLPYMTAVGDMAEYIEERPDHIELESSEMTAGDLKNIPVISVGKVITGAYGEDDGAIANAIILTFCGFLALTILFAVPKKPIPVMIFDLLCFGVFFFLSFLMKDDFIDADKYAWGVGYYVIVVAAITLFAAAVWTLVEKRRIKRRTENTRGSSAAGSSKEEG